MRKPDPASAAARKTSLPAGSRGDAPVELVCLALAPALLTLGLRIAISVDPPCVSRLFISRR